MVETYISINATVPADGKPGSPVIVFFDNGDWEIAFAGDVDYIEQCSSNFVGSLSTIDFLTDLRFNLDFDEVDTDGEVAHLYVEGSIETGVDDELVQALFSDGETLMVERGTALRLIDEDGEAFNFIPAVDIVEELVEFIGRQRDEMFESGEVPLDLDDEEGEDL